MTKEKERHSLKSMQFMTRKSLDGSDSGYLTKKLWGTSSNTDMDKQVDCDMDPKYCNYDVSLHLHPIQSILEGATL